MNAKTLVKGVGGRRGGETEGERDLDKMCISVENSMNVRIKYTD
jgi:hypothetical protein